MADQTAIQESTQALFCAIADYLGVNKVRQLFDIKKYPTYKTFINNSEIDKIIDQSVNKVSSPGVGLKDMESLLNKDNTWYVSSLLISKKLIEDITQIDNDFKKIQAPNWSDIFYFRGDIEVMSSIAELFKFANKTAQSKVSKTIPFTNINKWSPADIYFASKEAKDLLLKTATSVKSKSEGYSFIDLNSLVNKLIDKGDLLPLSLKKTTSSVNIVKVNFNRPQELKKIEGIDYIRTNDWKLYDVKKPQTRDLQIYFDKNSKDHIKFRHDPSTPAFKGEFISPSNPEARGGSLGDGPLGDIITILDPAFGQKFKKTFKDSDAEFRKQVQKLGTKPSDVYKKKRYDEKRAVLSALYVTNKVFPPIITWLNSDKKRAGKLVRMIYQYVTSRSETSSKFVIAK